MTAKGTTKKQSQTIVLGLLIALFALAALYQFVLVPARLKSAEQLQKRDDLRSQLGKARSTIRGEIQREKQNKDYRTAMQQKLLAETPPPDNALAWASQLIQSHTRRLGLQVIAISEDASTAAGWEQPDLAKRMFKPYSVRVELACGFEAVRGLVRSLLQANPYVSLSSVTLTADRQNVQSLGVIVVLEWPSWRDSKQAEQFQNTAKPPAKQKDV